MNSNSKALFEKKLFFFTGKGGVGKTTVSLALAQAFAMLGQKTLHISVSGQNLLSLLYERKAPIGYEEVKLEKNLYGLNLNPREALKEYALRQIKFEFLYRYVFENKVVKYFLDVTPGLDDLLTFGKIIDMLDLLEKKKRQRFDVVIVDMPATGHGLNMLRIPKTVKTMIPAGPLYKHAVRMEEVLADRGLTAVCAVTLPEEMPVNEALEMIETFDRELNLPVDAIFVNAVVPDDFSKQDLQEIAGFKPAPLLSNLKAAAQAAARRRHMQEEHLSRLQEKKQAFEMIELPFIYDRRFDLSSVRFLSQRILDQFNREENGP